MTFKYHWLIGFGVICILTALTGCRCPREVHQRQILSKFDEYRFYWVRERVVLCRPLRVYPIAKRDASAEYTGLCLIDGWDFERFVKFLDGRDYYEVPAGAEIFLGKVTIRERGEKFDAYFLSVEIPALTNKGFSVVYLMGYCGWLEPFPWTTDTALMELCHPDDVEKFLPGGKWKNYRQKEGR